jgi:hypothetical protein
VAVTSAKNAKVRATFPALCQPPCHRLVETNLGRRNFGNRKSRYANDTSEHNPVESYRHSSVFLSDGVVTNRVISVNVYCLHNASKCLRRNLRHAREFAGKSPDASFMRGNS